PPAPNGPGSSPPPSESGSSEASDGENSDTSGTEGTGSTNTDSTSSQRAPTPLLASLGNQFGIKTRILELNGNDPERAEEWLRRNGYDGWANGVVNED